jgi:hypothetical protein
VALLSSAARQLKRLIAAMTLLLAMTSVAQAQWVNAPVPGVPRTPDGKPDLSAPAPRTPEGKPDLSGVWHTETFRWVQNLPGEGVEVPMLPSAAAVYKQRQATMGAHNPQLYCMPHSVPDAMFVKDFPFKIIQMPRETVVLFEEFHMYWQIFTDGRTLSNDRPNPAWLGYLTGKWEGDTFVVEAAGFKEGSWLDNSGHPRTEQAHITERFRRPNFGSMDLDITIDDPGAYSRPWNAPTVHFKLLPEDEVMEHLCENNRDLEHMNFFDNKQ